MAVNLEALRRDFEASKVLAENQESRLRLYETRAHGIAMAYLIWERFFFFAISQASSSSSSLDCVHRWMVLGLSLCCTFVFGLLFLDAVVMLCRTRKLLDFICKKQSDVCQRMSEAVNQDGGRASSMEAGGYSSDGFGFDFRLQVRILKDDSFRIVGRKVYICAIAGALFAVTAFELYASNSLLCH